MGTFGRQLRTVTAALREMKIVVLIPFLVTFMTSTLPVLAVGVADNVPHRTSDDLYMDPCKAAAFWGDIALSDEEFRSVKKQALKEATDDRESNSSLFELQIEDTGAKEEDIIEDYKTLAERKRQLQYDRNFLKNFVKEKVALLRADCQVENKKECRKDKAALKEEIRKVRIKWKKVKAQLKQIRNQEKETKSLTRQAVRHTKRSNKMKKTGQKEMREIDVSHKANVDSTRRFWTRKRRTQSRIHSRQRRAATARKERLWDYGVIPYMIESNFSGSNKALFKLAMRHWENFTCVIFKEKEPQDENYILFTERACGCCSFVGKRGNGAQAISIGKNCDKFGIVVHELGHVIGFWHEHTRLDRDEHVQIIYKHILPGQEYNFNRLSAEDVHSLGETYDYGSIMHYARNTFARNTYLDTILPKRKPDLIVRPEIGQRLRLSPGDIRQANKLYKCATCGWTLQEATDSFKYTPKPGQPDLCQWRIAATHGEKIVLNITMMDIPKSYNCEDDYLEIRDGHYIKSALLGRFCGDQVPETFMSTGTRMWIEYRSKNGGGNGFSGIYESICGGEINVDEGYLTSPNYPDEYRAKKVCVWKITVGEGYTVALKFQSFEIENHDTCVYDYLEVRDGPSENSPLIGNFCGFKIPEDVKSSDRYLYVKFVSDGSVQKAGFSAAFVKEHDECAGDEHGCDHVCVNTLGSYHCSCRIGYELHSDGKRCEDACGGYLDAENDTITSPSYPELYPPNKNCVWQIVAPDDHKITITFYHFDLEGNNQDCEYDSIRVSSGSSNDLKTLGVFCGQTIPAPITSESNTLRIEFNSDNSVQKTGFSASFMIDKDECAVDNGGCQHICKNTVGSYECACQNGFTLHDDMHGCKEGGCQFEIGAHSGWISSPNYPEYYPGRKDCVWHFTTVPGHRIRLKFTVFELEPHQECTYDHVVVFDGDDSSARSLGKYCGALVPEPVISSGNRMFMLFFSDASVQRKGFHAEHTTVCGGHLVATAAQQRFVSHALFGDHNYENRENCEWKIQATEGQRIQLSFTNFDLEDETECGYDVVTIYNGLKDTDPVIGEFCGSELPDPIVSSSEYLLIKFRSDDTINWKGFAATYQLATPPPDYVEGKDIYDLGMV